MEYQSEKRLEEEGDILPLLIVTSRGICGLVAAWLVWQGLA